MKFDRDKVLAQGEAIELADGQTAHLRYSMASMGYIEEKFGSVTAMQAEMDGLDSDGNPTGKVFTALGHLICAGLIHLKMSESDVMEALDPARLSEYVEAAMTAFQRAMPQGEESGEDEGEPKTIGSPGLTSSTSPRSVSAVPSASSGA